MPCMCGDTYCRSCGPAQGNAYCPYCRTWLEDGGCPDPALCDAKAKAEADAEAQYYRESERYLENAMMHFERE